MATVISVIEEKVEINPAELNPLSPEVISRQATINIGI
jgi:hypothetical protein